MGLFRRFKAEQSGGVAMIFGLVTLPLVALAGGAIDYTRASMAQTRMQAAVDQAALSIVKLPLDAPQATIDKVAKDAVEAIVGVQSGTRTAAGYTVEAPVATRSGRSITIKLAGSAESAFMKLIGIPTIPLGTSSAATWSAQRIEIALVLDNTGSMNEWSGGRHKMTELISAATLFVNDARDKAKSASSIKISIVPFDTQVRVDTGSVGGQDWFRFSDPSVTAANWRGYLVDRAGSFAASDAAPTGNASKYPAVASDSGAGLPTILPLTSAKTKSADMTAKIGTMQPRGMTNIGLGVTWGTATLSAGVPFTEASTDPNVQRFMVVFTDGKNTAYRKDGAYRQAANPGNPSSTDPVVVEMNAYTRKACDEARKVATVYTIRLLEGDESLLRSCASPGNYRNVTQPADLPATFQDILNSILATRITS